LFCAEVPIDRIRAMTAMVDILIILFITAYLMIIFFTVVPVSPETCTM
jgi:hypothetical protein